MIVFPIRVVLSFALRIIPLPVTMRVYTKTIILWKYSFPITEISPSMISGLCPKFGLAGLLVDIALSCADNAATTVGDSCSGYETRGPGLGIIDHGVGHDLVGRIIDHHILLEEHILHIGIVEPFLAGQYRFLIDDFPPCR